MLGKNQSKDNCTNKYFHHPSLDPLCFRICFSTSQIQTHDGWVQSLNATAVLYYFPKLSEGSIFEVVILLWSLTPLQLFREFYFRDTTCRGKLILALICWWEELSRDKVLLRTNFLLHNFLISSMIISHQKLIRGWNALVQRSQTRAAVVAKRLRTRIAIQRLWVWLPHGFSFFIVNSSTNVCEEMHLCRVFS